MKKGARGVYESVLRMTMCHDRVGATQQSNIYNIQNCDKSLLRLYSNRLVSHFYVSSLCVIILLWHTK